MESTHEPAMLLTVKEAMQLLHRGRARIYELCATGEIETIRDGRSILIPRDALQHWIDKKRHQGHHYGPPH